MRSRLSDLQRSREFLYDRRSSKQDFEEFLHPFSPVRRRKTPEPPPKVVLNIEEGRVSSDNGRLRYNGAESSSGAMGETEMTRDDDLDLSSSEMMVQGYDDDADDNDSLPSRLSMSAFRDERGLFKLQELVHDLDRVEQAKKMNRQAQLKLSKWSWLLDWLEVSNDGKSKMRRSHTDHMKRGGRSAAAPAAPSTGSRGITQTRSRRTWKPKKSAAKLARQSFENVVKKRLPRPDAMDAKNAEAEAKATVHGGKRKRGRAENDEPMDDEEVDEDVDDDDDDEEDEEEEMVNNDEDEEEDEEEDENQQEDEFDVSSTESGKIQRKDQKDGGEETKAPTRKRSGNESKEVYPKKRASARLAKKVAAGDVKSGKTTDKDKSNE